MSKSVVFFDPHEDGCGCSEPKPFALTAVLNNLDGLHCPIQEAIDDIKAACPDADVKDCGDFLKVVLGNEVAPGIRQFHYRAIRYMDTPLAAADAAGGVE